MGVRVASIDIGTNTVLLLIAERDPQGRLVPIVERARITRLGQGVDRSRALAPEAVERTLESLAEYGSLLRQHGVREVDAVGTSAMRDAAGGERFRARAKELLGTEPRVVSGDEEARLTFVGGTSGLELDGAITAFDVGGGSTEIVRGRFEPAENQGAVPRSTLAFRKSLDIGSVRLFERIVDNDPPSGGELAQIRDAVAAELAGLPAPTEQERKGVLVGIAGTVTTLAAVARGIDPYDGARVHGLVLPKEEIDEIARRLASLKVEERRKLPGMEPKRADVIVAGACIVQSVVVWSGADRLMVSDRGVRWGLALELAARADR
jgi:exopolyphosphatase/guanosine-5'-triphosphate,3'-diphosphate pyrophosphatase